MCLGNQLESCLGLNVEDFEVGMLAILFARDVGVGLGAVVFIKLCHWRLLLIFIMASLRFFCSTGFMFGTGRCDQTQSAHFWQVLFQK